MIVRKMEEKDIDFVLVLEQLLYPTPWGRKMFEQEVSSNPYAHFFVAEVNGNIIGYYGFWLVMDEVMLNKVSVIPPLQRKGIASLLMQDFFDRIAKANWQTISLEVRVSNHAAQALYHKFGFQIAGTRKQYYSDLEDAYTMILRAKGGGV